MKNFLPIALLLIALTGCDREGNDSKSHAFLGGEIVNPNTDYVVLTKGSKLIDTILLDSNNRFIYKIENLKDGLYTFLHNPENQIVLLESGDSLHFRLNTMEFDESLVYTGKGAKKNNYLINLFLENEIEREKMLKYSQLSPIEFDKKIDSSTKEKHERLKTFERKNSTSETFNEIADANIHYNYYANKEIYPFAYYGNNELKNLKSLPEDFYSYRHKIDYNNENLSSYYPYYEFLIYHFNNIALTKHFKHSNDSVFRRNSLDYNLDRLAVIDSLVANDSIKNMHLKHTAMRFLHRSQKIDDTKLFLTDYLKRTTNNADKKDVKKLANTFIRLAPGTKLPEVLLVNCKGDSTTLSSIINKPSVVYFWRTSQRGHFKESHLKVKSLKEKYPEINFIAINTKQVSPTNLDNTLKQYNFPNENEYVFADLKKARELLVINPVYQVMLVDADQTIVMAYANMSSPHFEEQLLGLINQ